ncbi:glucohydrolase [Halobacteriales archaeon QS_1_68_17]|nr:MAG: glucohydrolase [Halobacteriales archaeon QS_1_68_17]
MIVHRSTDERDRAWWKEAVVYQIYPWSFNDSRGDGIGDLPGVREKVDYLHDLGVDVVWLTPVYDSPKVDNGYDIRDYRAILPEFGGLDDLHALLSDLHDRGMKLIMDLAVNHTSDEHEWFRAARKSRDNPYRDYYIWHPGEPGEPPNNWESHFGGSAWEYDQRTGEYYLHLYHHRQPDLNWANPDVRESIYEIMRWWLEEGIDGFRLDVINLLSKPREFPDGDPDSDWTGVKHFVDGPRIHDYFRGMRTEVFDHYDAMTVGEMPELTVESARKHVGEDGALDMAFQFEHVQLDYGEAGRWDIGEWTVPEFREVFTRWQEGLAGDGWNTLFLNNHDQPRSVSRFGDDDRYRAESAKLLATLLFTLRGTPFIYQGEEIGMTNAPFDRIEDIRDVDTRQHVDLLMAERGIDDYAELSDLVSYRSRDNARTPMQWSDDRAAGFTDGDPWITVNPNYTEINVERERADPDSVWHYYRELITLRDREPVLIYGDYELVSPDHDTVFAYRRTLDDRRALVALNVAPETATFRPPGDAPTDDADLLIGNYPADGSEDGAPVDDGPGNDPGVLSLRPYEARVYGL